MKAKKYLSLFAVSVAITLIILALTGFDVLVNYSNALFITGAIFIAGAIMSVVTYHGGFDTFGYSGHALVYSFRPEKGKKYNDMYEYVQVKKEKRRGNKYNFVPWLIIGAVYVVSSLIVSALL